MSLEVILMKIPLPECSCYTWWPSKTIVNYSSFKQNCCVQMHVTRKATMIYNVVAHTSIFVRKCLKMNHKSMLKTIHVFAAIWNQFFFDFEPPKPTQNPGFESPKSLKCTPCHSKTLQKASKLPPEARKQLPRPPKVFQEAPKSIPKVAKLPSRGSHNGQW